MAEMKNRSKKYQQDSLSGWTAIRWISIGLIVWVTLLAASSWLRNVGPPVRSILIVAPAIVFISFWCWLLLTRKKLTRGKNRPIE